MGTYSTLLKITKKDITSDDFYDYKYEDLKKEDIESIEKHFTDYKKSIIDKVFKTESFFIRGEEIGFVKNAFYCDEKEKFLEGGTLIFTKNKLKEFYNKVVDDDKKELFKEQILHRFVEGKTFVDLD